MAEGEVFSTRFQVREESGKSSNAKLLPAKGGCSRIEARLIVEHTPRTTTRWIDEETFAPWQISSATGFTSFFEINFQKKTIFRFSIVASKQPKILECRKKDKDVTRWSDYRKSYIINGIRIYKIFQFRNDKINSTVPLYHSNQPAKTCARVHKRIYTSSFYSNSSTSSERVRVWNRKFEAAKSKFSRNSWTHKLNRDGTRIPPVITIKCRILSSKSPSRDNYAISGRLVCRLAPRFCPIGAHFAIP